MGKKGENVVRRKQPRIGVTRPKKGNFFASFFIRLNLRRFRANVVFLYPDSKEDIKNLDGVIISGGSDIDPLRYGSQPHLHNTKIDIERDDFELKVLDICIKEEMPILGICRGAQLINIYFGGTLYPTVLDIEDYLIHKNSVFPMKTVDVFQDSNLFSIVKKRKIKANSIHNQAINLLGQDIKVTATNDKIIEAIEHKYFPQILGVQWHPEYLFYIRTQRKIFYAFIKKSKARLAKKREA